VLLSFIERSGIPIVRKKSDIPFTDESDRVFFDAAVSNGIPLVTGNLKHYPKHRLVQSVAVFLHHAG
jgi:hypothetical protein